jgi:hypothetical protein
MVWKPAACVFENLSTTPNEGVPGTHWNCCTDTLHAGSQLLRSQIHVLLAACIDERGVYGCTQRLETRERAAKFVPASNLGHPLGSAWTAAVPVLSIWSLAQLFIPGLLTGFHRSDGWRKV